MHVAIVGAGPTGLYLGMALARRGHVVRIVDRDPGPIGGQWDRKGVMQFHHAHGFRGQVVDALLAELPELWQELLAAGAEPVAEPGQSALMAFRCRRVTFERVLRGAAAATSGIQLMTGHVDQVTSEHGRASGLSVDGHQIEADLVLDASGRASRLLGARTGTVSVDCGITYASREYRLRQGASLGPMNFPIGLSLAKRGYQAIVFVHDNRVISVVITRATTDRELVGLREPAAFDAAVSAIPGLDEWTAPDRCLPITKVLPAARLFNSYRGQLDETGRLSLPGRILVGDAVSTTNPTGARGITTAFMQARTLVTLLDEHGSDLDSAALAFDEWCTDVIRPWFDDHLDVDGQRLRRWAGEDIDPRQRIPSDLVAAAAEVDAEIAPAAAAYASMTALPDSLHAFQSRARDVYATGWRPPEPPGPSRDELAALVARANARRAS